MKSHKRLMHNFIHFIFICLRKKQVSFNSDKINLEEQGLPRSNYN